jgi:hypothetical protein
LGSQGRPLVDNRADLPMTYTLILYEADASEAQRRDAERRFRDALEQTLGDAALVVPVYTAYLRIVETYGEAPLPDSLTEAERAIFDQWQAAETAAVAAAFGPNRYMGDALYEIRVVPAAHRGARFHSGSG